MLTSNDRKILHIPTDDLMVLAAFVHHQKQLPEVTSCHPVVNAHIALTVSHGCLTSEALGAVTVMCAACAWKSTRTSPGYSGQHANTKEDVADALIEFVLRPRLAGLLILHRT